MPLFLQHDKEQPFTGDYNELTRNENVKVLLSITPWPMKDVERSADGRLYAISTAIALIKFSGTKCGCWMDCRKRRLTSHLVPFSDLFAVFCTLDSERWRQLATGKVCPKHNRKWNQWTSHALSRHS